MNPGMAIAAAASSPARRARTRRNGMALAANDKVGRPKRSVADRSGPEGHWGHPGSNPHASVSYSHLRFLRDTSRCQVIRSRRGSHACHARQRQWKVNYRAGRAVADLLRNRRTTEILRRIASHYSGTQIDLVVAGGIPGLSRQADLMIRDRQLIGSAAGVPRAGGLQFIRHARRCGRERQPQ